LSHGVSGRTADVFVSSRELRSRGTGTPGYSCLTSDGTDPKHYVKVGRCAAGIDNYICTSVAENCKNPNQFESKAELRTLLADVAPDRVDVRAFFSSCLGGANDDEVRCYWSTSDCPKHEGFEDYGAKPYSVFLECPCEETQVGACKSNDTEEYFCAVSEKSCDGDSTFLTVKELQEAARIDCRLCQEPIKIPDVIASATPAREQKSDTGSAATTTATSIQANDANTSQSVIIGVVVGGIVLGIAIAMLAVRVRRCRMRRGGASSGGTAIVVETADINKRSEVSTNGDETGSAGGGGNHSAADSSDYL